MGYYHRMGANRRRKNPPKATVTRDAKALLAAHGYLETPEGIAGTGKNGNITKGDVQTWLDAHPPTDEEE